MEIIRKSGIWRLFDKTAALLITDERQLETIIEDPEKPLNNEDNRGYSGERKSIYEENTSLADICRKGKDMGAERLEVSYDFFFGGNERRNYPDSEITVKAFKVIHDVARSYGLDFSASIISPLDIGAGYAQKNKAAGFTCQYMEGSIDRNTGRYCVDMVLQKQWTNNKGPIKLELDKVLLYAFTEERLGETNYFYVDPDCILDISHTAEVFVDESSIKVTSAGYGYGKMKVFGEWRREDEHSAYDRCLAVAVYRTPELDYFNPDALQYIKSVIDLHKNAGITYQGFYSDEMHIQFDWDLEEHFGHNEINTRYITENLAKEYANRYGDKFKDFIKYLIYFSYHQHDFLEGCDGGLPSQHVMDRDAKGIYETWLFRKHYFEMLQQKVVGLSIEAKTYAEQLFGAPIMTRAHATWQESPTCDHFHSTSKFAEMNNEEYSRYDYTPSYVWSSSIRENTSACYDYFRWNDFLSGGGTDHPEGSFTDRNYYAEAFAVSLGMLNKFPYAYCAAWGSPDEVLRRINSVRVTYGNMDWSTALGDNLVQGMKGRITDVLALYPLDLNHVEERFGSWMVQYGYCDYITEEKLLENGAVTDEGTIRVKGRSYRALLVLFQPFIKPATMQMMKDFVNRGGRIVWSSIYPVQQESDDNILLLWKALFGVEALQPAYDGIDLEGKTVCFENLLKKVRPMEVLTGLLPDRVYPVQPALGAETAACSDNLVLGTAKKYNNGGLAVYLGFRLRDDQSCSTGRDVDTLFSVLKSTGCYRAEGAEVLSRPADSSYIVNTFENGSVSLANHYRTFSERWEGRFFRDEKRDAGFLKSRELPPEEIQLDNFRLFGHAITYRGTRVLTYNLDSQGRLIGFAGSSCTGIAVDGRRYRFADNPARIIWGRLPDEYVCEGIRQLYMIYTDRAGTLKIPIPTADMGSFKAGVCDSGLFRTDREMPLMFNESGIQLDISEKEAGKWIAVFELQTDCCEC